MDKKKIKVLIGGTEYTLVTSECEEYVQKVAIRVDRKLKEIKRESTQLTNAMAALLAAINLSDEYIKLEDSMDNLRKQIAEYSKNENRLTSALDERSSRVKVLEEKVQELKIKLARHEGGKYGSPFRK